jgi:hypothetical protein
MRYRSYYERRRRRQDIAGILLIVGSLTGLAAWVYFALRIGAEMGRRML